MRVNLGFEYDKLHLKEITILIPKYHHNLVSFLTPVLGLYGVNVKEFITEFESKTKFINFDIIIPVRVKISKIKTFQILIKTPYVTSILENLTSKSGLNALTIYKLTLVKSVFLNHMLGYQKLIYSSIRKYLSKIVKVPLLNTGEVKLISIDNSSGLFCIKSALNSLKLFKNLIAGYFGVFVIFNNENGRYINYLKSALSFYCISINKVKSKMLSSLVGDSYFYNNVYYISSLQLAKSFSFLQQVLAKSFVSNLFPIYFRFGSNLTTVSFFRSILAVFNKFNNALVLIKILNKVFLRPVKSLNYLNKNLLFLVNYKVKSLNIN
jgi:hypothetical protein